MGVRRFPKIHHKKKRAVRLKGEGLRKSSYNDLRQCKAQESCCERRPFSVTHEEGLRTKKALSRLKVVLKKDTGGGMTHSEKNLELVPGWACRRGLKGKRRSRKALLSA